MKFYQCSHCKNIVAYLQDNGPKVSCCGEEMKELVANTTDAAKEKHVPVVEVNGNLVTVSVGSVTHPMEEKHYIQLLALAQMGGRLAAGRFLRCEAPAVVINQAGATETTGVNWLLPVAAKDSYQSFFSARVNDQSYCVAPREALPQRVRLWARSE